MRTEASRRYNRGFVLTEQELRRIHDVADQQMKRALPNVQYATEYEMKFRNGAISTPKNLDEIFEGENWGSTAITRVSMYFREIQPGPKTRIGIKFADARDAVDEYPIAYTLEGDDRDWVFVASSQLSERITRVERFNATGLLGSRLLMPALMLILTTAFLFSMTSYTDKSVSLRAATVRQLRHEWTSGTLHDPIDAILRIEESDPNRLPSTAEGARVFGAPVLALVLLLLAAGPLLTYMLPPYNFVWAEYQREYEKRKGRVRFVLVGIVLAIIIGVLVNFLSKKLGW